MGTDARPCPSAGGGLITFKNPQAKHLEVPLPTDQIVLAEDGGGVARVGFGGMSARENMEDGQRVFYRVRDLQPAELMSPPAWSKDNA